VAVICSEAQGDGQLSKSDTTKTSVVAICAQRAVAPTEWPRKKGEQK